MSWGERFPVRANWVGDLVFPFTCHCIEKIFMAKNRSSVVRVQYAVKIFMSTIPFHPRFLNTELHLGVFGDRQTPVHEYAVLVYSHST